MLRAVWIISMLGCGAEEQSTVGPGVLFEENRTTIDAPTQATANQPFAVKVTTWGNSCTSVDSTPTSITDDGAIIAPLDRTSILREGEFCLQNLMALVHATSVTLTPGLKTLHIQGLTAQRQMVDVPLQVMVE